jgi:cytoskeleton-associated protein 5
VEKGLAATRPVAKQKALEAILLYIELDKPDPIIEELLPILSHKQPKIIAATLACLTQIYHAYGCKTVEPKPVLKLLPKVYGHADKNVRAEAQNLTVELYRWLKEAMKPLFWNDLKPVQQTDLDKLFEKVKDEPAPKQERLLRSQQEKLAAAAAGGDEGEEEEEEAQFDLEPEFEAVNVMAKIPKDFSERLASSKWKDRKEALDDLHAAINVPRIEEGPFDDIMRGLAKSMKDANIAVVAIAANCVELFAKGLKKAFNKYRSTVMSPMIERLKEKKTSVTDAIGAALDAVFASSNGFADTLEETLAGLTHKNPQVKLESTRFLIRSLAATREAPAPPEVKSIADAATKLLTDSNATQRDAGAEVLGTLWKIMGDRIMNVHLDGLDEIRKTKIKEFHDKAEVKAKFKPKAAAPPPKPAAAAAPAGKRPVAKKAAPAGLKKPAPARPASPPLEEVPAAALAPRPTTRPGASKLAALKSGLAAPGTGLRPPTGLKRPGVSASPARRVASPTEEAPIPTPKLGLGRGLAGRPLGKPANRAPTPDSVPVSASGLSGLSTAEKAELDELRAETERLRRENEHLRQEKSRQSSQIHELTHQNAQLIEDHTRDVLSIKAKETQLVRARSDEEEARQSYAHAQREIDRLKRELSRQVRASSPAPVDISEQIDNASNGAGLASRSRSYVTSPTESIGKENSYEHGMAVRSKLTSPPLTGATNSFGSSGSQSPRRSAYVSGGAGANGETGMGTGRSAAAAGEGAESWRRAAEVTQNLKARIEMMKVSFSSFLQSPMGMQVNVCTNALEQAKQGLSRPQH